MSSILFTQDCQGRKVGDVVSRPFFVAKDLIAKGVAVYWNGGEGEKHLKPASKPVEHVTKQQEVQEKQEAEADHFDHSESEDGPHAI